MTSPTFTGGAVAALSIYAGAHYSLLGILTACALLATFWGPLHRLRERWIAEDQLEAEHSCEPQWEPPHTPTSRERQHERHCLLLVATEFEPYALAWCEYREGKTQQPKTDLTQ